MIDLITGHQGVAHISADQIASINNAMMDNYGANKVMRLVGGELTANGLTIEVSTGYWRANGFDMEVQEAETIYIDPTAAGLSRIDNIYVEILQDIPTGAQRSEIVTVNGEPSATPTAPEAPTAPELNTDILLQVVPLASVTVTEGAMVMTDLSVAYEMVTPSELEAVETIATGAQTAAGNAQTTANTASTNANNALGMIRSTSSDAYSSSKAYSVGDHVIYNNKVYKCITACSAGSWSTNQSCFSQTTLTSAVTDLNSALSHIGMIIHSTTLDTEAKVKAIYGSNTSWIQHSGYMLRGATNGVTANSAVKTGGQDGAWLMTHTHTQNAHSHGVTLKTGNITISGMATYGAGGGSWGSGNNMRGDATVSINNTTATNQNAGSIASNNATINIPNYKSVYIWERTA